MRKRGWLQLLVVLALAGFMALFAAGCGGGPGDTVEKYLENIVDGNYGEVYDMLDKDSLARKVSKDEFVRLMEEKDPVPEGASMSDFEVLEEKIEGDKATVKFKVTLKVPDKPDDTDEDTMKLVKEDGDWKIDKF